MTDHSLDSVHKVEFRKHDMLLFQRLGRPQGVARSEPSGGIPRLKPLLHSLIAEYRDYPPAGSLGAFCRRKNDSPNYEYINFPLKRQALRHGFDKLGAAARNTMLLWSDQAACRGEMSVQWLRDFLLPDVWLASGGPVDVGWASSEVWSDRGRRSF